MEREFIQEQNDLRKDYKIEIRRAPFVEVLKGRPTKGTISLVIFAIVVPLLVYYFVFDRSGTVPKEITDTCLVDKTYKIQCGRSVNVSFDYCSSIQCCFDNSTQLCFHYLPSKYQYSLKEDSYQRSLDKTPFGREQLPSVDLTVNQLDDNTLQVVLHDPKLTIPTSDRPNSNYQYKLVDNPLSVDVYRKDSKQLLLTTAKGPTIVSDNYWEWSFQLSEKYLFGLGKTLIELDENSTLTRVIYGNEKEHNVLPNFLAYDNGSYHGLVVRHSGPLEVTVLPSNLVSLKSLVGTQIVLELSVGPSLKEVLDQQRGQRDVGTVVDIGALGVHICRLGASTSLSEILNDISEDPTDEDVSYQTDCLHQNLLLALQKETNSSLVESVDKTIQSLRDQGRKFLLSMPPHVVTNTGLYNATKGLDVFFKLNTTTDYQGEYLDQKMMVYPHFQHKQITSFIEEFLNDTRSYFSSWPEYIMLNNNWPSDGTFTMEESPDFQYLSEELIAAMSSTLPWNITSSNQSQFIDHNDYGAFHLTQIKNALSSDSPFVMTASHNFNTDGPIMVQNVDISWTDFQNAITTILYNSISGFPLTSIPVCGSTSNFTASHESLCMRWYLMAATSPLFWVSSESPRRDPASLGTMISQYAANLAKSAIELRLSLLQYFYEFLVKEEPLMRPMFYDFPDDTNTFGLVEQYMVGRHLMVAHPTLPDQSKLNVYLPKDVNWFDFNGGLLHNYNSTKDGWMSLTVVETDWIGFIREGAVLPVVKTSEGEGIVVNTVTLKVALKCDNGKNCAATGVFQMDAQNWLEISSSDEELTVKTQGSTDEYFVLDKIEIYSPMSKNLYFQPPSNGKLVKLANITSCSYSIPFHCS